MYWLTRFLPDTKLRPTLSWALFDFANSAYFILIVSLVFPLYFKEVVAGNERGDFYWGLLVGGSVLLSGLISPLVGALADYDGRRHRKFVICSLITIGATLLLYLSGAGRLFITAIIFVTANLFYELSTVLYDTLLISVSSEITRGRISGLGWGLGYIGGIVVILVLKPLYGEGYSGELENLYRLTFPIAALWFLFFAIPSFLFIRDKFVAPTSHNWYQIIYQVIQRTKRTLSELQTKGSLLWFLVAYFLLTDALVTIFAFIPLFARSSLGLSIREIVVIFIIVQVVAFPATILGGWLEDKFGPRRVVAVSITGWLIAIAFLLVVSSKLGFYITATLGGLVIGPSQSVVRSWFSKLIPLERRAEFFGFTALTGKVSATIAPVLFGAVSSFTGSQRLALLTLVPFLVVSLIIFSRFKTERVEQLATS
ncbi:MAG: MFS transporter [Candidatus Kerfeldbacteria bacterium]|nr:MFS transporter [Candidatus Kerfeldbacteria bacterium]